MTTRLGDYLTGRRRELGMDRKTLAALSGLSYPYVSQLETSPDKTPSEKALRLLAPALEVELEDLLEVAGEQVSGPVTSTPPSLRHRSSPVRAFSVRAVQPAAPEQDDDAVRDLVRDLRRRLAPLPPADQLVVLHQLQARALDALARERER